MIGRPPLEGLYPESPADKKAKDSAAKEKEARRAKEREDLEALLKEEREKAGDGDGDEGPTGDDVQKDVDADEMVLTHIDDEPGKKAPAARSRNRKGAERTEAEKEEDALETMAKTRAKPKGYLGRMSQGRRRLAIIGIVALILVPLLYFLVIPRTEVVITVQYSEGFQNAIYLDAKAENRGTRPVDGMTVKISVVNDSDVVVMTTEMDASSSISLWSERDFDFHKFQGNQRVNYALIIDVELESAGHSYSLSDTFYVKDYMNQRFELTVRG